LHFVETPPGDSILLLANLLCQPAASLPLFNEHQLEAIVVLILFIVHHIQLIFLLQKYKNKSKRQQ